ncbi:MAG: biopolymer transporter ExbD [Bacteroidaceae bacterium]|nr:biopolymer transporter ExbD [Candidatus Equimonas faecalis]MCQ2205679.1 biopolymer transporter ExbD [Bacteroidaceae bacterium]
MGRFKISKQDTFIDMTPMSDVMVLLLTFFMLTATFVKEEPVKVNAPQSLSEVKIPENNLLTIFVSPEGKVFMNMDNEKTQLAMAEKMQEKEHINLSDAQLKEFSKVPTFGCPADVLGSWIDLGDRRNEFLTGSAEAGIPCDSVNDELKLWVAAAREANGENMHIAIKGDKATPYKHIKRVMDSLRAIDESRYNLLTNKKGSED